MLHSPEPSSDSQGVWPGHRNLCEVLVKIGGSILDHDDLTAALVPAITALARQHRIVILTGGGQAAKRIKANQSKHGAEFYRFWRATGLFPEVNAYLLASYSPTFGIASCAAEITACLDTGQIAVFAPAGAILNSLYFLPDWLVTTDSFGLYFAKQSGARRYVIVSDVDGIYERRPHSTSSNSTSPHSTSHGTPITHLGLEELEQLPSSKLDRGFVDYYRRFPLPTSIVNGHFPDRVTAAIRGSPTLGTQIAARGQST